MELPLLTIFDFGSDVIPNAIFRAVCVVRGRNADNYAHQAYRRHANKQKRSCAKSQCQECRRAFQSIDRIHTSSLANVWIRLRPSCCTPHSTSIVNSYVARLIVSGVLSSHAVRKSQSTRCSSAFRIFE